MNGILDSSWSQIVAVPTRGNNVLDYLFTKNLEAISNICISVQEPLGDSDHGKIITNLSVCDTIRCNKSNYKPTDD